MFIQFLPFLTCKAVPGAQPEQLAEATQCILAEGFSSLALRAGQFSGVEALLRSGDV